MKSNEKVVDIFCALPSFSVRLWTLFSHFHVSRIILMFVRSSVCLYVYGCFIIIFFFIHIILILKRCSKRLCLSCALTLFSCRIFICFFILSQDTRFETWFKMTTRSFTHLFTTPNQREKNDEKKKKMPRINANEQIYPFPFDLSESPQFILLFK